jgi:hypothetical protein
MWANVNDNPVTTEPTHNFHARFTLQTPFFPSSAHLARTKLLTACERVNPSS